MHKRKETTPVLYLLRPDCVLWGGLRFASLMNMQFLDFICEEDAHWQNQTFASGGDSASWWGVKKSQTARSFHSQPLHHVTYEMAAYIKGIEWKASDWGSALPHQYPGQQKFQAVLTGVATPPPPQLPWLHPWKVVSMGHLAKGFIPKEFDTRKQE